MSDHPRLSIPAAIVVAIGLASAGWFAGNGFAKGRASERTVTVKGVSERDVEADLALWPLEVVGTDNDLSRAQAKISAQVKQVREFLRRHGIDSTDVALQQLDVSDAYTNQFNESTKIAARFVLKQTLMVRSNHPLVILAASQQVGELVGAGVVLGSGDRDGSGGPTYVFTKLNDLKPKMIAEATTQARAAAEQFARDSKSELGGIHDANQGVFEIHPRDDAAGIDEAGQIDKKIRVVSTVTYTLKD